MGNYAERIFRIEIPESQTVIAVPTSNRDGIGDALETCDYLQSMEDDGWLWMGQITRHWRTSEGDMTEYLDVFHRVTGGE